MTAVDPDLREGLETVTVEMLAAAWVVVRDRYPQGRVLGPGSGFREAIAAALERRPLCDLEARIVEAETNAEVSREFAETSRRQVEAAHTENAHLTAEVERLRAALEAAEACLSIVEPRTDRAEYMRTLNVVRAALQATDKPEERPGGAVVLRQLSDDEKRARAQALGDAYRREIEAKKLAEAAAQEGQSHG